MLSIALRRAMRGQPVFGKWTPSFALALATTIVVGVGSLAPGIITNDHYWLAWLGQSVLHGGGVPHALGPESPLDAGKPWVAQEWLSGTTMEAAREAHGFALLAVIMGAGFTSFVWLTLSECIRRRVGPSVTFFAVLQASLVCNLRVTLRAEDFGLAVLVGTYWIALRASPRVAWLALPPLFVIWANLHASFFLGFAVCAYAFFIRRATWGAGLVLTCAAATLINPFGTELWAYALWLPHSWVRLYVTEWLPAWKYLPSELPGLLVPALAIARRANWRRWAALDGVIWIGSALATVQMCRWAMMATAFGVPAGAGAVRMRNPKEPAVGNVPLAIALAVIMAIPLRISPWLTSGGLAPDPDFGIISPRHSLAFELKGAPIAGRLAWCANSSDCSVVLFNGGITMIDGRTDPFPEHRVKIFYDDKWAVRCYPQMRLIVTPVLLSPADIGNDWEMRHFGWHFVYWRDSAPPASARRVIGC